jgi:S1-C subfamily serine protease
MSIADGRTPEGETLDAYSQVVTTVAERLTPSVASLRVIQRDGRGRGVPGAGSGVVISPDGFVITSAHVVAGTSRGSASFVDGHEARFEVVGRDPLSDLAVLRLDGDSLHPADLGDASTLREGQMPASEDEHPVQALRQDGSDPSLGEGVRVRSADRGEDHLGSFRAKDLVERAGEL